MTRWAWIIFPVFVVASGVVSAIVSPTSNAGFPDAASVIAVVTMVAVVIERAIELVWTLVGQELGGWWPLNKIRELVDDVEKQSNLLLGPIFGEVRSSLEAARKTLEASGDDLGSVEARLVEITKVRGELQERLDAASKLAPGSARFAMATQVASDAAQVLGDAAIFGRTVVTTAAIAVDRAANTASIATSIFSSFTDNPARRIASILIGAGLGMLAAGFIGLNIFGAILGVDVKFATGNIGVLLTGIVMGLGSSPTHEVIKSLQEYKESRKPTTDASIAQTSSTETSVHVRAAIAPRLLVAEDNLRRVRRVGTRTLSVPIRSA
jgi:hypothetical protein